MLPTIPKISSSPDERAKLLEQTSWLPADMSYYQIKKIASYFELYRAQGRHIITKEGKVNKHLGIITHGKAYVMKTTENARYTAVAELGPNRSFGEMSMLDKYPSSATVMTSDSDPFEVLMLEEKWFDTFMQEDPCLALPVLKKIARDISLKLRRTTGILVEHL